MKIVLMAGVLWKAGIGAGVGAKEPAAIVIPKTMQAAAFEDGGGPEVLALRRVQFPP